MKISKEYDRVHWTFKLVAPVFFIGYLVGFVLVLCWYWWDWSFSQRDLRIQLKFVCPVVLVLALLNWRPTRCILALAIPSLCSSRGRAFLVSLAFILVAIGPAANILANLKVLLRSLACGQQLLRQALGQMLDVIMEPVNAIRLAVDLMLTEVNKVLNQIMSVLLRMQEHLMVVIDTLKNCGAWLKSVVDLCNTEMGTPWERCKATAHQAMVTCQDKMGVFKALCHATKLFLALCYPAKLIDVFCTGYWDLSWDLLDKILQRYREFVRHIEQMFDANITFEHKFFFDTNSSKSLSDIEEEIMQDINGRLSPFIFVQSFMDILSVLTSVRLTMMEWLSIIENSFFMITTCLQIFAICLLDYSLFWLLAMMSYYGHQEDGLEVPAYIDLEIRGGGFVADVMRGIAGAFRPLTQKNKIDSNPCLPLPIKPDYSRYVKILMLCLLAWVIVLVEPYVLRSRHCIMAHFYPKRANERLMFLYRKISESRIGIFKFARRRVRNEFIHQGQGSHFKAVTWLREKLSWCSSCCSNADHCTICGATLASSNSHFCDTPECKGVYCDDCFEESKHKCCLCKPPLEYGDFSDCSVVEDSSEFSETETYKEQEFRKICKVNAAKSTERTKHK
ncbi:DC-STAMP domain-containing protein 2 isoform X2 [Drosophila kikkawai]|uniref:DC-STAMP domain-containing protein 2 isoform X2 n=1 Tax=Drosophila kikkawai TaxID=30033 RepID=A0ABM4GH63_DROKI